jgi:hypothetical protein
MTPLLRGFAENQPMTPIFETHALTADRGHPRPDIWVARASGAGILVVRHTLALGVYRRSAPVTSAQ